MFLEMGWTHLIVAVVRFSHPNCSPATKNVWCPKFIYVLVAKLVDIPVKVLASLPAAVHQAGEDLLLLLPLPTG